MSLQFDIQIAGIDVKSVEKAYKEQEAKIQAILNKASTLTVPIKNVDVVNLNKQLQKTSDLLNRINKSGVATGTPLQRAKADIAYMEYQAQATLRQKKASLALSSAQSKEAIEANKLKISEERLAQAKLRTEAAQKRQTLATQKQNVQWEKQRGVLNGMPQFLNAYVSILGAFRLVNNIKNITKEFELQRVSLRAITQDLEFADELFEKIKKTAIESPFSTKDLITYSKQLSAYRIENENLFDTMNKLADISAGLGVSMDRLILAYGQVKAASVLRGQELRQFTEAGIPLVALLADKFTELKGEMVSTADVFELISKRAVPFELISEIFDDMTEAGGRFYNMQKIQAESLYGVYENLRDNIQIAFNELGERNRGALMITGKVATELAQNLGTIVDILTTIGTGFVGFKVATALTLALAKSTKVLEAAILAQIRADAVKIGVQLEATIGTRAAAKACDMYAAAQTRATLATNVFAKSFWKMLAAFAKSPIGAIVAAIATLGVGLGLLIYRSREAERAFKKMSKEFTNKQKSVESYTALLADLNEQEKKGIDVTEERAKVIEQLTEVDADYSKVIKDKLGDTEALTKAEQEYIETARVKLSIERALLDIGAERLSKKYTKALDEENAAIIELTNNYNENITAVRSLLASSDTTAPAMRTLQNFLNAEGEYSYKLYNLIKSLQSLLNNQSITTEEYNKIIFSLNKGGLQELTEAMRKADIVISDFNGSWGDAIKSVSKNKYIVENLKAIDDAIAGLGENPSQEAIDSATGNFKNNIIKVWEGALDAQGIVDIARDGFATIFEGAYGFAFKKIGTPEAVLSEWQNTFNTYTSDLQKLTNSNLPRVTDAESTQADILKEVTDLYKDNAEELDRMKLANTDIISQDEINKQQIFVDLLKQQMLYLGGSIDSVGSASDDRIKALDNELSYLKQVYDRYKELKKYMDSASASASVKELFGTDINEDLYVQGLKRIMDQYEALGDEKKTMEVKIAIDDIAFDDMIDNFDKKLEDISNKIKRKEKAQDFFDKIFKLTGDVNLAKNLSFTFDGFELGGIRDALIEQIQTVLDRVKLYGEIPEIKVDGKVDYIGLREFIKEIPPEYQSALDSALNMLIEYDQASLEDIYGTVKKYSEYEQQKTRITNQYADLRAKAYEQEVDNIEEVIAAIDREEQAAITSLNWDQFKTSEEWTNVFDDLERVSYATLTSMMDKLEEFKDKFQEDGVEAVGELISKLKELRTKTESMDPFGTIKAGLKEIKEAINEMKSAQYIMDSISSSLSKQFTPEQIQNTEAYKNAYESYINAQNQLQSGQDKVKSGLEYLADAFSSLQKAMTSVADLITEVFGDNEFSMTLTDFAKGFGLVATALGTVVTMIYAVNVAVIVLDTTINTLMPYLWALVALAAVIGGITASVNAKNRNINKAIEAQNIAIEKLKNEYNRLKDAMDDALGDDKVKVTAEIIKNLEKQINKTKEQIRLEKERKKRKQDTAQITAWEQEIADLQQQIINTTNELVEYFAGTSLTSAAESFADSWLDAYLSFKDTKEALESSVADMVKNLVAKAVLASAVEAALEPVFDKISKYASGGFTTNELNDVIDTAYALIPGLEEAMSVLVKGINLTRKGETNLTGISKDIAGITEESALALGALGNNMIYQTVAIKNDVATIRTILEERIATEAVGSKITLLDLQTITNTLLSQLISINQNTSDTANACKDLTNTIKSVTSVRGTGSVKVLNTQLV